MERRSPALSESRIAYNMLPGRESFYPLCGNQWVLLFSNREFFPLTYCQKRKFSRPKSKIQRLGSGKSSRTVCPTFFPLLPFPLDTIAAAQRGKLGNGSHSSCTPRLHPSSGSHMLSLDTPRKSLCFEPRRPSRVSAARCRTSVSRANSALAGVGLVWCSGLAICSGARPSGPPVEP